MELRGCAGERATEHWDAVAAGGGINWERLSCSRPSLDNTINKGPRSRPQTDVLSVSQGTVRQGEQLAEDLSTGTRGWLNWIWNKVTWAARILEAPPRSHQFEGKWMRLMLRLLCEDSRRQVRPREYWHGRQYWEISSDKKVSNIRRTETQLWYSEITFRQCFAKIHLF